jgi:hypothetical protein
LRETARGGYKDYRRDRDRANATRHFSIASEITPKVRCPMDATPKGSSPPVWRLVTFQVIHVLVLLLGLKSVACAQPLPLPPGARTVDRDGQPLAEPSTVDDRHAMPDARLPAWGSLATGLGALAASVAAYLRARATHQTVMSLGKAAVAAVTPWQSPEAKP